MLEPTPFKRANQHSALKEADLVNKAIGELVTCGYAELADSAPVVCSPLSVVTTGSGKKRLVVNLRHVNQFLWKKKF